MITANHSRYTISHKLNMYDAGSTYTAQQCSNHEYLYNTLHLHKITKTLETFNNPKI